MSNQSIYRIESLHRSENYVTWVIKMWDILDDMDLGDHIEGPDGEKLSTTALAVMAATAATATAPAAPAMGSTMPITATIPVLPANDLKKWQKKDQKALIYICIWVEEALIAEINNATTALEAWNILKKTYSSGGFSTLVVK